MRITRRVMLAIVALGLTAPAWAQVDTATAQKKLLSNFNRQI